MEKITTKKKCSKNINLQDAIECVYKSMDKGYSVENRSYLNGEDGLRVYNFHIRENNNKYVTIGLSDSEIRIYTPGGELCIKYELTDRDKLELDTLVVEIKEYREKIAIDEFSWFSKIPKVTSIYELDDDDDKEEE